MICVTFSVIYNVEIPNQSLSTYSQACDHNLYYHNLIYILFNLRYWFTFPKEPIFYSQKGPYKGLISWLYYELYDEKNHEYDIDSLENLV